MLFLPTLSLRPLYRIVSALEIAHKCWSSGGQMTADKGRYDRLDKSLWEDGMKLCSLARGSTLPWSLHHWVISWGMRNSPES